MASRRPASPELDWRVVRSEAEQLAIRPDVRVACLAAEEWGVLSAAELRACGLLGDAVAVRERSGRLHKMHRGVYAVGHANPPLEGRFLAAVKACGPGAVLSHFAAAAHWRLIEWEERPIDVASARAAGRGHAGIRAHRTASLDRCDVTRHRGIPITTPARTLVDLAAVVRERRLRRAVRQALSLRLTSVPQLNATRARLGPRRGAAALARILAGGHAPTRSELEDVVLDLVARGGLAPPDVNVPLRLDGQVVIPDFRWPEQRLCLEADGAKWHANEVARRDDAERQALLEAHGERVVRVTWEQAIARPAQTLVRIRRAGAPPRAPEKR